MVIGRPSIHKEVPLIAPNHDLILIDGSNWHARRPSLGGALARSPHGNRAERSKASQEIKAVVNELMELQNHG
jgi:hypothetical protein